MSSITGIGVDMEEIDRIERAVRRFGDDFTRRIFSEDEIAYCSSKHRSSQHYTARFAAKEAFAKAIGTGWRGDFRWTDVAVVNDALGKPELRVKGPLLELVAMSEIHLSLAHTRTHVVAVVVIERSGPVHQPTATKEIR